MNKHTARLLEQHFDTAFSAPDGIKKLRELILTLAMQGKLVPQDPNDQPASELLLEIEAEKQQLVKEGKIKKPKPLPPVTDEEKPYALPQGWEWVRLGELAEIIRGVTYSKSQSNEIRFHDSVELLRANNIQEIINFQGTVFVPSSLVSESQKIKNGDILIAMSSGSPHLVGKAAQFESNRECTFGAFCAVIRPRCTLLFEYFRVFSQTPLYRSQTRQEGKGIGIQNLNKEALENLLVAAPPLNEQHRIIAKIDELMTRCDELEKLRAAQQEKRRTVHAAAIKQLLNIADPEQHQHAQSFLAEHFGELYTVKENVAELRKAILQLAVMGKLVPQNPNDQPASELLKEIEAEKQRLVEEGKIKKPKPFPPVSDEEKPYALPQGWEWVRVIDIVDVGTGSTPATTNKDYYGGEIPWYTSSATNKLFTEKPETYITEKALKETNCKIFPSGSLIIALYGQGKTRGQISELSIAGATNQAIAAMVFYGSSSGTKKYLKYFFIKIYEEIRKIAEGAAQPNLNVGKIKETLVPLPPLSEQNRIVTKIDELMVFCDTLDQQINIATSKQSELLNALMHVQSQSTAEKEHQPASPSQAQAIDLTSYRAAIGCYAVKKLANARYFGRTAAAKAAYLAQAHAGLKLNLQPEREAAGPLDKWIYDFEQQGQAKHWFEVNEKTLANGRTKTEYRCLPALSEPAQKAESLMSPEQKAEFDHLIYSLADKTTEQVEIIATLFAVWNDFLIDGIQPTNEQIITDLRENWHESKARFSPAELKQWLDWLRKENLVPRGLPPRTVQQSRMDFN
ncbi:restriction endonuclease subunit S [Cellvibrio japonicus]|uniref:Type I restriction-modification system, S subunit n=1 Tax=Cellvibrio japonicus (strain Ueda107) TaxID=498211 RepID=B3PJM9_CELJU|nr:restriction endonuclease subunit S [Cellvibrio japonicus]ACE85359.1 type I restriction-modification system, S subunit [Cellvibrio japonicus Ueda107]QEI11312.1 restriction endonuclease subunit S [Cellvibrio japonicus]QEI14886.1 restriction endonuclease subunit S [Cellvibrio japonicus]QEI18466.1 restriction endonuclease subunit S [Cellvibrio japonicus]